MLQQITGYAPLLRPLDHGQVEWYLTYLKLTIPFRHPWTNGQVEVMNRIIKNHTTKNYYYDTAEALKKHLMAFLMVYNYQRPLRALKFLSPYDKIIDIWNKKPYLFRINPYHKTTGLNS